MFTEKANGIFERVIADYHKLDDVDQPSLNPYTEGTIEHLLYEKNWVDTVQWHLEDIIRDPQIDPVEALKIKRRIDRSNQVRTDMVEYIDSYMLEKYKDVAIAADAKINTETPAWAIDRLSILALKIYHMHCETVRTDVDDAHRAACQKKLDVLLSQQKDLGTAIEELIEDIEAGRKYMKTYKQMKMYNDPSLNPVLYGATKQSAPTILVVRMSAMGDVAMLPHAVRALKKAYPELKVTIATRKLFEPFFAGLDVDFMFLDPKVEHDGIKGMLKFTREVKRLGIDAVADTHFVLRSMIVTSLLALSGVKFAHIRKGKLEKWFRLGYSSSDAVPLKHTVVRYCDVFRRLGFVFDDPEPIAEKPVRENPFGQKTGLWVGFAPFSAHAGKTYPDDMSREAVALLAGRYERVFIHGGGGAEREFALDMERKYPNVTALSGKVKLSQELDLISHLDCVVSMDSLVMHMCSLMATPVVSVWSATHPELGFLGYGCDTEGVLQQEMECRPCSTYGNKPCKWGDIRCMRAVTPQMIADRVEHMIGKNRSDAQDGKA